MVARLMSLLIVLASAAVGLGAATLFVDGFRVESVLGFVLVVVVLTVLQAMFTPILTRLVGKHVPALEGGVSVISALLALLVVTLARGGVVLDSISAWVLGTLVLWVVTGAASAAISAWWRRREEKTSRGEG